VTTNVRATILGLVRKCPALHEREIERHLELPDRLAAYHLASLEQAGLVQRVRERGFVRYYAAETTLTPTEMRQARVLRRDHAYQIALLLVDAKERTPSAIALRLGMAKPTLSYHLALLQKAGVLQHREEGRNRFYSLRHERETRRVLHLLPPLPGALDEFSLLWDDLVG
jgi:predicted transcriptional regulator